LMGAGWSGSIHNSWPTSGGSGTLGYGAGGSTGGNQNWGGVITGAPNSGQGANGASGSGYCLIKWYE